MLVDKVYSFASSKAHQRRMAEKKWNNLYNPGSPEGMNYLFEDCLRAMRRNFVEPQPWQVITRYIDLLPTALKLHVEDKRVRPAAGWTFEELKNEALFKKYLSKVT